MLRSGGSYFINTGLLVIKIGQDGIFLLLLFLIRIERIGILLKIVSMYCFL
jgi:hypothetical protein